MYYKIKQVEQDKTMHSSNNISSYEILNYKFKYNNIELLIEYLPSINVF